MVGCRRTTVSAIASARPLSLWPGKVVSKLPDDRRHASAWIRCALLADFSAFERAHERSIVLPRASPCRGCKRLQGQYKSADDAVVDQCERLT